MLRRGDEGILLLAARRTAARYSHRPDPGAVAEGVAALAARLKPPERDAPAAIVASSGEVLPVSSWQDAARAVLSHLAARGYPRGDWEKIPAVRAPRRKRGNHEYVWRIPGTGLVMEAVSRPRYLVARMCETLIALGCDPSAWEVRMASGISGQLPAAPHLRDPGVWRDPS